MKTGFCHINVNDPALFIDPRYQREPEKSTVKKIQSSGWDEGKAGVILANYRPDEKKLAVIDGGNRLTIARMIGVEKIGCQIIQITAGTHDNPVANEARLHVEMNADRKKNSAVQLWKAESNYDHLVIETNERLHRHGFRVEGTRASIGSLACVDAIRKVLDMGGPELVETVVSIVAEVWQNIGDARDAIVIRGLGHFLHFYPHHDRKRLLAILSKRAPSEFIVLAREFEAQWGWTHYFGFSSAILEVYNQKIKAAHKLTPVRHNTKHNGAS